MDAGIKPHRVGLMQIRGSYEQLISAEPRLDWIEQGLTSISQDCSRSQNPDTVVAS